MLQNTNIQVAMQRLMVLEKKVSRIHDVVSRSRSILHRERIGLGLNAVATGERSVSVAGCAFVIFMILLALAVVAVCDQLFKHIFP